jgi:hypothetical protein
VEMAPFIVIVSINDKQLLALGGNDELHRRI